MVVTVTRKTGIREKHETYKERDVNAIERERLGLAERETSVIERERHQSRVNE